MTEKVKVKTISKDSVIDKSLIVEGKREYLSTGMSLIAEIKTGK